MNLQNEWLKQPAVAGCSSIFNLTVSRVKGSGFCAAPIYGACERRLSRDAGK
jgi:hypothetical protein